MKSEPVSVALRHVAETKHLLESLIHSSESFDYPQAKVAIGKLQQKIKQLGKLQTELQGQTSYEANVEVVDFRKRAKSGGTADPVSSTTNG